MPRELIFVPSSQLLGMVPIDAGYPRDYTEAQMRSWAAGLQQDTVPSDPYFGDPNGGIKGSLLEDGRVELDGGRHRAYYLSQSGAAGVPVWVSSADQRSLDRLRVRSAAELRQRGARSATRERT